MVIIFYLLVLGLISVFLTFLTLLTTLVLGFYTIFN